MSWYSTRSKFKDQFFFFALKPNESRWEMTVTRALRVHDVLYGMRCIDFKSEF